MATKMLKIGSALPNFKLKATDKTIIESGKIDKEKLLLVIFGCNHCPYVKAYEERIINLQNMFSKLLQVVEINSNDSEKYPDDSFEEMVKRSADRNFPFPYLHDKTQNVAKQFGATHTPEAFLFNKKRELIYHGKIDDNWQEPENVQTKYLENAINEELAEKEISIPETYSIGCTIKWK